MARVVYEVAATAKICRCALPPKVLAHAVRRDRAIQIALAHWSLYVSFWGEYTHWLEITVTDTRDGVIEWRNGASLTDREGNPYDTEGPGARGPGRRSRRGRLW